jgi:hypothetical protein
MSDVGASPRKFFSANAPGLVISGSYARGNAAPSLFAAEFGRLGY